MRVYLITHPESAYSARIDIEAHKIGLPVTIVDAVFIDRPIQEIPDYDHARRMFREGYPMLPGEIGCFFAHRAAWQRIVDDGTDTALVLEDDVVFNPGVEEDVVAAMESLEDRELLRLCVLRVRQCHRVRSIGRNGRWIGLPNKPALLTVAYALRASTASRLLEASKRFHCPVDHYVNRGWEHGCIELHLQPFPCRHADEGITYIGDRTRPPLQFHRKLCRRWMRFVERVRWRLWHRQCMSHLRKLQDSD